MTRITTALGLLLLLGFPSQARGYEEIAVADGGTIRGIVKTSGKAQKLPPVEITKFKENCRNVPNESLVVGPNQGVRYAVVTIEGIARGKPLEREAVHELDNRKCVFVPHVLAASVGHFLLLKNTDPILHTVHAFFNSGQPQFNVGLYPGKATRKPLVGTGIIKILCEVHPWMSAYLAVADHPYNTVTDAYGQYEMTDVPPGVYRVQVWHETLGVQERSVEVKPGAASELDFILPRAAGGKK